MRRITRTLSREADHLEQLAELLALGDDDDGQLGECHSSERELGHDIRRLDRTRLRGEIGRLRLALALVRRPKWEGWARRRLARLERALKRRELKRRRRHAAA